MAEFSAIIIKSTINSLNPVTVTTSTAHYKSLLQGLGHQAGILPIFSNLPQGSIGNTNLYAQLPAEVLNDRNRWYITALFGSIHPFVGIESNLIALKKKAQADNKKLLITHVGRS